MAIQYIGKIILTFYQAKALLLANSSQLNSILYITSCSKTRPLRVSTITKPLIFGTIVGVGGGNWIAEALRVWSRSGQFFLIMLLVAALKNKYSVALQISKKDNSIC